MTVDLENVLAELPGAEALIEWFGFVPDFHDAELLGIEMPLGKNGRLQIHAFRMTDQVDSAGYYILDRHILVTFIMEEISDIALRDFDLPGIIFRLWIERKNETFRIVWDTSHGVSGAITAKGLRVELDAWQPAKASQ